MLWYMILLTGYSREEVYDKQFVNAAPAQEAGCITNAKLKQISWPDTPKRIRISYKILNFSF